MKSSITLPFLLAIILFSLPGHAQKNPFSASIQSSEDSINAFLKKNRAPGLAITVVVQGKVVWSKGFGFGDLEQKVPVDPAKTKFRIASISKSLTATGLAILYEQGKIQLDSSIYFYLPDFPKKRYRPTVRQLAGHIAGIRTYVGEEFFITKRYNSVTDAITIFQNDSLLFKPGTGYEYTTLGFNLLSAVMEKAVGKDFLSFMNEQVFKPLQMKNTVPDLTDSLIAFRSRPYEVRNGRWYNTRFVDNSYKWAGGGFLSTSEDLAKFGNQYLQPGFLKKETVELFTTSQKLADGTETAYGIGWGTRKDKKGKYWFGHSGGAVGGSSDLVIYPKEKVVVVILVNLSGAGIDYLAHTVADLFIH